ncbi:MAG: type II toxin-antitoxin system VapC family toxin [Candidatus Njordarchaeales archaeon]
MQAQYLLGIREDLLVNQYTINLALYELGNVIWKECFVFKSMTPPQAHELIDALSQLLDLMKLISIKNISHDIMNKALQLGITYYDAAYAHIAEIKNLVLVTEDKRLINTLKKKSRIRIATLEDIK